MYVIEKSSFTHSLVKSGNINDLITSNGDRVMLSGALSFYSDANAIVLLNVMCRPSTECSCDARLGFSRPMLNFYPR